MRNIYEKIVFAYTDLADKLLPVGRLVRRNPYVMIFKTTNYCGYKCAHCCENSGPDQAKSFIPPFVIKNIYAMHWPTQYFRVRLFLLVAK